MPRARTPLARGTGTALRVALCFVGVCCTCAYDDSTMAQGPREEEGRKPAPAKRGPFAFEVVLRPSYDVGTPVFALAVVTNRGETTVSVPPPTSLFLRLEVRRPAVGEWEPYPIPESRVAYRDVAPGKSLAVPYALHLHGDSWWIEAPGTYTVRARYRVPKALEAAGPIEAGPYTFTVAAPEQPAAREAARLLLRPDVTTFLARPGEKTYAAAEDALTLLSAKHADTRQAAYADIARGRMFAAPRFDPETKTFRADHAAAAAAWRAALARLDDPVLAGQTTRWLKDAVAHTGEKGAAQVVADFFERFPEKKLPPGLADWVRGRAGP